MNSHYTYFLIHAASLSLPLILSFDKKVAFYKKWKYVFPAILLPAIIFIAWDAWFTKTGIWRFNENYITGWKVLNLPVEEILFFFTVPYCCLFIYACVRAYFPRWKNSKRANAVFFVSGIILLITGLLNYFRAYTFYTFCGCGIFIMLLFIFKKFFSGFDAFSFLVAYLVILIPFLVVNRFLTAEPVVIYDNSENLAIRIFSIPIEDVFYGMLLVLMNITAYEKLKK